MLPKPQPRLQFTGRCIAPPLTSELLGSYPALADELPDEARQAMYALLEIVQMAKMGLPYVLPELSLRDHWDALFDALPNGQRWTKFTEQVSLPPRKRRGMWRLLNLFGAPRPVVKTIVKEKSEIVDQRAFDRKKAAVHCMWWIKELVNGRNPDALK